MARSARFNHPEHAREAIAAEEQLRDAALSDDRALVAYEQKWDKRLERLQRAHPSRWRVPGLSDEELRAELTLRLLEAVRAKPEQRVQYCRPDKEWGLVFLDAQRRSLRAAFKLKLVPGDTSSAPERSLGEEERLIEAQSAHVRALAQARAENALSRPQRRWLAALKLTANAGGFFAASGRPNLAAASRMLDKNRSSAQRAFDELRRHFQRELAKLER